MKEVVIVGGVRTAIGRMGGTIARFRAEELGAFVLRGIVDKTGIDPAIVEDVVMGLSNSWHAAYNPARWAVLKAGLPYSLPGVTVERQCSSGLQAMNFAATQILAGLGDVYIAGGMESWSQCPWMIPRAEEAYSFTPPQILRRETAPTPEDSLVMGVTAENLVTKYKISREEQDTFGLRSQERAFRAIRAGYFKNEIIPIILAQKKGQIIFDTDEHPRETTLEKLAALTPVFKKDGTVTAGTSSGRNDGAAAVLMMTAEKARELGYKPLARWVTCAAVGVDPKIMGIGPAYAIPKALKRAGLKIADMDVVEINEAFASQVLACVKELEAQGHPIDMENLNPLGGAIAFGHPNGMSGTRISLFAIKELQRRKGRYAVASLCIGGGQGLATIFERL
ncbi:MAG: Acetyl-CoA acetyltransferase (thiolase II-like) [Deltaproteobacteria bacterium]|nr:Acetyl-CoA acetyltransferase (thiolase II-like) [Deltaproteobacteria bacterium]